MNIKKLKYFQTICMLQSVSEAAAYLHISQPSLSGAIKDLEEEYGVLLFYRHHHGMSLTPEGEALYRMSKDVLERSEQLQRAMKDLGNRRKKMRLGVPPMIGSLILPRIYGDFLPKNEDIEIEITECGRQELAQRLSDRYLDMVFLPHDHLLASSMIALQLAHLEIVCCTALGHPVARQKKIEPNDLIDTPLVLFGNSFFQTEKIKKWFSSGNVEPNIILQTEQLSTMQRMISEGLAVGFMFRQLAEGNPHYEIVPTEPAMFTDVSLVRRKEGQHLQFMKKLEDYIKNNNPFIKEQPSV